MRHKLGCLTLMGLLGACGGSEIESDYSQGGPVIAMFEGRQIDLSKDWEGATACLVWREAGITECYRTEEKLSLREGELDESMLQSIPGIYPQNHDVKSGRVNLYWNSDYNIPDTGLKAVHLLDRSCQYLRDFGMSDEVSSSKNRASTTAYLWRDVGCRGSNFPLPPGSSYPHLSAHGWNDKASSVSRN